MMAMETILDNKGVFYKAVKGTDIEHKNLMKSYSHLCNLRDSLIEAGVIPSISEWSQINPNL